MGFRVRESLFEDVLFDKIVVNDKLEGELVVKDVEFVDMVAVSDSVLDAEVSEVEEVAEVSQLSSHDVALSIRDVEAVVPE